MHGQKEDMSQHENTCHSMRTLAERSRFLQLAQQIVLAFTERHLFLIYFRVGNANTIRRHYLLVDKCMAVRV